jgi:hypothetical protein
LSRSADINSRSVDINSHSVDINSRSTETDINNLKLSNMNKHAHATDYLPHTDSGILNWGDNFINGIDGKGLSYYGYPQDRYNHLVWQYNDYKTKYTAAQHSATSTKGDLDMKTAAHEALVKVIRQDVQQFFAHNPNLTPGDRDNLGLPNYDPKPTPVPDPTDVPEIVVKQPAPGIIEVYFKIAGSESRAKAYGIHGAEVAWAILDAPTVDWRDLTHSSFATHSPLKLTFEGPDRGKVLYFAVRWENSRGVKGPWTTIMSIIIP